MSYYYNSITHFRKNFINKFVVLVAMVRFELTPVQGLNLLPLPRLGYMAK